MNNKESLSPATQDLLVFGLNGQGYAIPINVIVQIIAMVTITPIPQVNPIVAGVINVRGVSVPVINTRRYLGQPDMPLQLHTPIILVRVPVDNGMQPLGLIVDEVLEVIQVFMGAMTQLPDILPAALRNAPSVQGVVQIADGLVILLDLEQFFAPDQPALWPQPTTQLESTEDGGPHNRAGLPLESAIC